MRIGACCTTSSLQRPRAENRRILHNMIPSYMRKREAPRQESARAAQQDALKYAWPRGPELRIGACCTPRGPQTRSVTMPRAEIRRMLHNRRPQTCVIHALHNPCRAGPASTAGLTGRPSWQAQPGWAGWPNQDCHQSKVGIP